MDLSHLKTDFVTVNDGFETVRLRFPAGDPFAGADRSLARVIRRPLAVREQEASRGRYQAGDVQFAIAAADTIARPIPGCLLIDADNSEFTVLECRHETFQSVFLCTARNLVISERLDTLITVQEATYTKGVGGAEAAEWNDLHTNVRARIQPTGGTEQEQHGRRTIGRTYKVFVREMFVLRRHHRIVGPDGVIYRVTGFEHSETIGRLTELSCEEYHGGP